MVKNMKPKDQRTPNLLLRRQRLLRGWSLQRVVDEICALSEPDGSIPGVSAAMVSCWEMGKKKPSPFYQERLCMIYGLAADQLGLMDVSVSLQIGQFNQNTPRRSFLHTLSVVGTGVIVTPQVFPPYRSPALSKESISNLATITQQYRAMQRRGDTFIRNGLNTHISTLQDALENTNNENLRRELWSILAHTQLVTRLNWHSMKKLELAQVKALNEAAIVSAQNSGDKTLIGAALGHLGHLYLREEQDTRSAYQLLYSAREHVQKGHILHGWFDIVTAAITAKEGNRSCCEAAIADAMDAAHRMPQTTEYTDLYFTDFSIISVTAFAGNCWLSLEEPKRAYALLTTMKMEELAVNRQASALYDISRAYLAAGQREEAQAYAFRSIDIALATKCPYIIPRFITLAQNILSTEHNESHAAAILEYARLALQV